MYMPSSTVEGTHIGQEWLNKSQHKWVEQIGTIDLSAKKFLLFWFYLQKIPASDKLIVLEYGGV